MVLNVTINTRNYMQLGTLSQVIVTESICETQSFENMQFLPLRQDQVLELVAELNCLGFQNCITVKLKFVQHYTRLIFNYLLNTRHDSNHYIAAINLSILAKSLEKKLPTINHNTTLKLIVNSSSLTKRKHDSGDVWISDLSHQYQRFLQFCISNFFSFTVQL